MLRIHRSYNGEAAVAYFDQGLSKEGEYYTEQGVIAHWQGETAKVLDLHGKQVTKNVFSKLVHNINPHTNERLTVRNADGRRAGFEFMTSPVKSLSVLYAITKDPALLEAHREANRLMMEEIEQRMQVQNNSSYGRFYSSCPSIIYASFEHFTSRPNEMKKEGKTIYVPDPLVHTHNYVPNVAWHEKEQRFRAIETGNIYRDATLFQEIYHSHLSYFLNQADYVVERTPERYKIIGLSRELLERYSNRTKSINEIAKKEGITDPKQLSELGARTRHSKAKSIKEDQLYEEWKDRLTPDEFQTLHKIKGKHKPASKPISAKEAVDHSFEHFLERNSTVQEGKLLAHALKLGYGTLRPDDVRQALTNKPDVLRSEIDTIGHLTTRPMVHAEDKMIALATEGKGEFSPINENYEPKQDFLNEQQKKAIKTLLSSTSRSSILRGSAGSGKTSLLTEIRDAIKEKTGREILAVAPSSQASRQVLRQQGFDADTISALLHNPELQKKLTNNVLLVDEAGMIGVKNASEILSLAKKHNSRVIWSGDTGQHGAPGQYGDALRIMQDKAQLPTATVQKIVRQKPDDYRKAIEHLAKGRNLVGYQALDKMNAIQEVPDTDERLEAIADGYVQSVKAKRSALIISPTHFENDLITNAVRSKLKAEGRIKGPDRSFEGLKNLSFTQSQKQDLVNYQEGQIVRFTKNQKGGFKAGSHYEVLPSKDRKPPQIKDLKTGEIKPLPHEGAEYFDVYERKNLSIAKGDLITVTANTTSLENSKINNGNTYRIAGFGKNKEIKLDNGKTLSKDMQHIRHGIVSTSHASQGKTVKDVYISMSNTSLPAVSEQHFYVSASRGTHSVKVFTDDKKALKQAVARSGQRMTARQVADDHNRVLHQQKQRAHHRTLNEKLKDHARTKQQGKSINRDISGKQERSYDR